MYTIGPVNCGPPVIVTMFRPESVTYGFLPHLSKALALPQPTPVRLCVPTENIPGCRWGYCRVLLRRRKDSDISTRFLQQ